MLSRDMNASLVFLVTRRQWRPKIPDEMEREFIQGQGLVRVLRFDSSFGKDMQGCVMFGYGEERHVSTRAVKSVKYFDGTIGHGNTMMYGAPTCVIGVVNKHGYRHGVKGGRRRGGKRRREEQGIKEWKIGGRNRRNDRFRQPGESFVRKYAMRGRFEVIGARQGGARDIQKLFGISK